MSYYEDIVDLRVEAIITKAKPRLLWLQLEGLLYLNNNEGWSLTGLKNDTPHMDTELLEHLWVHIFNDIHSYDNLQYYGFFHSCDVWRIHMGNSFNLTLLFRNPLKIGYLKKVWMAVVMMLTALVYT